ncbi:hypothetical protein WN944_008337 [Citrus x changshan-huyou]|uniref:VQ domain-containing protein n=1 Tax=Citrus x changshan-huyou TaxID=2935761 RepID=A0AAP0QR62_9ROSI
MDSSSDFPVSKSPRRELQGPRPAPLKVRKDSYKIKKPPVAPPSQQQQQQQQHHHHHQAPAPPPRQPVIIYTVSPKVIHTNPNDFMTLVQRLTGSSSSSTTTTTTTTTSFTSSKTVASSSSYDPLGDSTGAISPAARYASIEKAKQHSPSKKLIQSHHQYHNHNHSHSHNEDYHGHTNNNDSNMATGGGFVEGIEMDHNIERSSLFPGILSPGPTSLPMIPPSFFSPPSDPNSFSFLYDLSPVLHGNKNFIEGSFMPSPSGFNISPHITSPTPPIDLFNNFFDF